ncbi:hypothetical protein [Rickettsiales endosymbiont of Stachyamoeba lipophora]|uniref:hypothetical protein n=1 Tax=Rickettsiales endosymbiont of Stachyamoeba lipophora TaxID=2486578 RepID=UPI000F655099|nr:hypothetical protein [Rickettsiales endosymbiont of Stachyamoeba lipophora]AZL15816.1 hypothetical protein EF513_04560 [Rickettsiales endosymbiont of Stachyamoeba lipophora]
MKGAPEQQPINEILQEYKLQYKNINKEITRLELEKIELEEKLAAKTEYINKSNKDKEEIENNETYIKGFNYEHKEATYSIRKKDYTTKKNQYERFVETTFGLGGAAAGAGTGALLATKTAVVAKLAATSTATKAAVLTGGIIGTPAIATATIIGGMGVGAGLIGYGIAKGIEDNWSKQKCTELEKIALKAKKEMETAKKAFDELKEKEKEYDELVIQNRSHLKNINTAKEESEILKAQLAALESKIKLKHQELSILKNKIEKTSQYQDQDLVASRSPTNTSAIPTLPAKDTLWTDAVTHKTTKILTKNTTEDKIKKLAALGSEFRSDVIDKMIPQLTQKERIKFENEVKQRNWWQSKISSSSKSNENIQLG